MVAVTEEDVVVAAAAAEADDNPNAAPPSAAESTVVCGGGECCEEDDHCACEEPLTPKAFSPERIMRFNVACAIVDLRHDTCEFIQTYFLSKPARRRGAMAAAGGSDGGEQLDGEFDDEDLGQEDEDDDEDIKEEEEEEEDGDEFVREFRKNYIKASGFDDRMKELDAIEEVYFDVDLDDETRTATILELWSHMEKELRDRARAVSTGKFKF